MALSQLHAEPDAGDEAPEKLDRAVLVIDDVHLVGDLAARQVLTPFLAHAPAGLRLVLCGRSEPVLGLTRWEARGELGVLAADDLAFSPTEVREAAGVVGRPLSEDQARALHTATGGWPVAVRLALIARQPQGPVLSPTEPPDIAQLPEYLVENVLEGLGDDLRAFVLSACTSDWLTGTIANALAGGSRGAGMLEDAVAAGLPIERRGTHGGEPVYRWHPLMAHAGRVILQRRDPELCRDLNRRAARALAVMDPFQAASHALRGKDPGLAASLLRSHWLAAALRGDAESIAELAGGLPAPWSDDPELLAIRAACLRNSGEAATAVALGRRAQAAADELDAGHRRQLELTLLLARLFVIDPAEELAGASERARLSVEGMTVMDGHLRACAYLLIGWTELRLRHTRVALPLLAEAARLCDAEGMNDLADRARANRNFGRAFAGDFAGARAANQAWRPEDRSAGWRRADGGIEWFTEGWIRFWSGDADGAQHALERALDEGGGLISYGLLARCWLVDAAVATGNLAAIARYEPVLVDVPDHTVQGLPWGLYRGVALAGVALARGKADAAAAALDRVVQGEPVTPAANVLSAELYWRCGRAEAAREQAEGISEEVPGYLRVGALVVRALCEQRDRATERAHRLIEEALALGEPQRLMRPFVLPDAGLGELLADHAARGSGHAAFLGDVLARRRGTGPTASRTALTERERQVAAYLHTTMSTTEIASALFISQNTMKSHLKSIYAKLGVSNRRDAVRALRGSGV